MFKNNQSTDFTKLCQNLEYQFKNKELLITALTRKAAQVEGKQLQSIGTYQRLEFLGDKVIGLAVSELLFESHQDWTEGELTQATSYYVNNSTALPQIGRKLNLDKFLISGRDEELRGILSQPKVLADAVEALFGAIFLDCGKDYNIIRSLIQKHWEFLGLLETTEKSPPIATPFVAAIDDADRLLEKILRENNTTVVKKALAEGANPNLTLIVNNRKWPATSLMFTSIVSYQTSALIVAILNRDIEAMKSLLQYGADPNWEHTQLNVKPHNKLYNVSMFEMVNQTTAVISKKTPLHVLVESFIKPAEIEEAIRLITLYGANVSATDFEGKTALDIYREITNLGKQNTNILELLRVKEPNFEKLTSIEHKGRNNFNYNAHYEVMDEIFGDFGEEYVTTMTEALTYNLS